MNSGSARFRTGWWYIEIWRDTAGHNYGDDIIFLFLEWRIPERMPFLPGNFRWNTVWCFSGFRELDVFAAQRYYHDLSFLSDVFNFYESDDYLQILYWLLRRWTFVWGYDFWLENWGSYGQIWNRFWNMLLSTSQCYNGSSYVSRNVIIGKGGIQFWSYKTKRGIFVVFDNTTNMIHGRFWNSLFLRRSYCTGILTGVITLTQV